MVVVLSLTGPQQGSPRAVPVHLLFLSRNLLTFTNTISHNHSLKKFYNESVIKPCNVHQCIPARHTHGV